MEQVEFDGIIFTDTLQAYNSLQYAGRVTHILCQEGNMGFTFQETRYNIAAGDYVILPNPALVSGFSESDKGHLFREELLGSLLTAHILDLYDIHARGKGNLQVSEHTASLLRKFIELLYRGEYIRCRNLNFYASELCITPHYLSEICRKISGRPATYWIDRFTLQEIIRLLRQQELSLTVIAERLNFSSVSYFSRYVQKRLKHSPSEYRKDF